MCQAISGFDLNGKITFLTDAKLQDALEVVSLDFISDIVGHGFCMSYHRAMDDKVVLGEDFECEDEDSCALPQVIRVALKHGEMSYIVHFAHDPWNREQNFKKALARKSLKATLADKPHYMILAFVYAAKNVVKARRARAYYRDRKSVDVAFRLRNGDYVSDKDLAAGWLDRFERERGLFKNVQEYLRFGGRGGMLRRLTRKEAAARMVDEPRVFANNSVWFKPL